MSGTYDLDNDGLDYDADQACDATDSDDDNDGLDDDVDSCEQGDLDWDSTPVTDHDTDGCQDDSDEDLDDDNDGASDVDDDCATGDLGWTSDGDTDYDTDGCQDDSVEDLDDDNDGVNDDLDSCFQGDLGWDSSASTDWDSDGCQDASNEDLDDDNDFQGDDDDDCDPDSGLESDLGWMSDGSTDYDDDGCQDATDEDLDDDNDGVADDVDACASGDLGWTSDGDTDYDGDGCQDDSAEDLDDDNDGAADDDDSDDNNIFECSDNDQDGCEDCLSGYYDTSDDGADSDADGQCDIGDVDLPLHANANLISFFALPEDQDYSVETVFGPLGDNIVKVLGESQVGLNLGDGFWVGSLDAVAPDDGYWAILNADQVLEVQGLPTAPVTYGLHEGNNLISYDHAYDQNIEDAFPASVIDNMDAVYGEGVMAAVVEGEFFGALNSVDAGRGYWVVANESFVFEYNDPSGLPRFSDEDPPVTEELYYVNTTNQYFYFIETATIEGIEIHEGDWVVAYNGNVVVGARQYKNGGMIDLPIMGYDDSSEQIALASAGYCKTGDTPIIKVHSSNGSITTMNNVNITSGSRTFFSSTGGGHAMVTLSDGLAFPTEVALHNAYPNPFNPVTTIEYDLPSDMFVNLSIYDIRGRLVADLVNELQSGSVNSYQVIWNAELQSSGVYFVRLIAGDAVQNQKIMLIK